VSANSLSISLNSVPELDPSIYSEAFRGLYSYIDNDVSSRAARTYIESGREEFESKQYQSAIADLTRATEIAPLSDEAWYYLAESYKESGDSIHATQAYSRIVNEMPDSDYAERARDNLTNGAATDNAAQNEAGNNDDNNNNGAGVTENDINNAALEDAAAQQAMVMQAMQEAAAGAAEAE
ncbi:MAG: tetratricopeptide repeat protein, partial [Lachnospiraceae bacterium]|nr:tetratricopeptide repeat protein [Lachnospiraceae bacterium]